MDGKLKAAILAFEDFLNEPPQYEDKRMVRDYRHAAYARWSELRDQITAALPAQEGQDISTAVAAERERCAKIAETEGAEYQRQIDIHNKEMLRLYPSPDPVPDYFRECGVYLHAKRSASQNIGGLIRLPPAAYEAQLAAGVATLIAEERTK